MAAVDEKTSDGVFLVYFNLFKHTVSKLWVLENECTIIFLVKSGYGGVVLTTDWIGGAAIEMDADVAEHGTDSQFIDEYVGTSIYCLVNFASTFAYKKDRTYLFILFNY